MTVSPVRAIVLAHLTPVLSTSALGGRVSRLPRTAISRTQSDDSLANRYLGVRCPKVRQGNQTAARNDGIASRRSVPFFGRLIGQISFEFLAKF